MVDTDDGLSFSAWLPAAAQDPYYKVRPRSPNKDSTLLFKPEMKTIFLGDGCVKNLRFAVEQGVLIKGEITPAVEDTRLIVSKKRGDTQSTEFDQVYVD